MGKRILVTGAGTGASNNLIRSLRAGDPSIFVAGCNDDRFVLKKTLADRKYFVATQTGAGFVGLTTNDHQKRPDRSGYSHRRFRCRDPVDVPEPDLLSRFPSESGDYSALSGQVRTHRLPARPSDTCSRNLSGIHVEGIDDLFARLAWRTPVWCEPHRALGRWERRP